MQYLKKVQIGNKEVLNITNPSGVVFNDLRVAKRYFDRIPGLDIWTMKTTGVKERLVPEFDEAINPDPEKEYGFRAPILTQLENDPESFVNAVGLTNYGMNETRRQLLGLGFPKHKAIVLSVFGGTPEEAVLVIKTLDDLVNAIEINGGCPNSEKGGMIIGTDPDSIYNYVSAARKATNLPIWVKMTPNVKDPKDIGTLAQAVKAAGGDGAVLINTKAPKIVYDSYGNPILTRKQGGGISGRHVKDLGIKCVEIARSAVGDDFLIVGEGGIRVAQDARDYRHAGADIIAPGSAGLKAMSENETVEYYATFIDDLKTGRNNTNSLIKKVDMKHTQVRVTRKIDLASDFKLIETDFKKYNAGAGQYVFARLSRGEEDESPKGNEAPFSVVDNNPLTLAIQSRGCFTKAMNSLEPGDEFYIRGPCGNLQIKPNRAHAIVVGGCGAATAPMIVKTIAEMKSIIARPKILIGVENKNYLFYLDKLKQFGDIYVATRDGSTGKQGVVTDLFPDIDFPQDTQFFNCGPEAMIDAVIPIELRISRPENILSSTEAIKIMCGERICGSCADKYGRLTCHEGPLMPYEQ